MTRLHRRTLLAITGAFAAFLILMPAIAAAQRPTLTPPRNDLLERGVPALYKSKVPFNAAFSLSEIEAARNPELLNRSMRARRHA
jgi:hypothetical protein